MEKEISQPDFWSAQNVETGHASSISKKYEGLKSELEIWERLKGELDDLFELSQMSEESGLQAEIFDKLEKADSKYNKLEFQVLFAGVYDKGSVILSIHAGTGGVDAMDWAGILLRMYLRFCESHGFDVKVIDKNDGSEAGIKSSILEISGRYAYGWLKSENGVHRLVRISPFDAEKMRHTSFALVEVLPDIEEEKFELNDDDLRIDVMRAGGHGGQSVNTTDSAVRITHIPTNIVVKCQNERSQLQNKQNAMKILKARLLKHYEAQENEKLQEIKGEYQQAEWGSQARSYVMQPYQLVKDHRTDYETVDIAGVLDGDLDKFVEEYLRSKVSK